MSMFCIEPEKLYKKDPKLRREDVKILQEWLKKQHHLPKIEESQLILFLHGSNYKVEKSKTMIDAYFRRKTLYPEIFCCPCEDEIRKILSVTFKAVMPIKTPEGYNVLVSKLVDYKADNFNHEKDILHVNLIADLHMHKQGISDGIVCVIDFKGATLGHLAKTNFHALKHELDHIQEGLPVTIQSTHIVNTVHFMDKVLSIIKPLLSSQLFKTIYLHSSFETLYKFVPKECLPEDYGGDLPSCQILQENTTKEIFDNIELFKWLSSQQVDESKRIDKTHSENSIYGTDGTFKKLTID